MKKALLAILSVALFPSAPVKAQTFSVVADTVWATVYGVASVSDNITNITASDVALKWHVKASDFPTDWLTPLAFGICDNSVCRANSSNMLWNASTSTGDTFLSVYKANATHDSMAVFSLSLDFTSVTSLGVHWVTVNIKDTLSGYTKDVTFVLNKKPTGIININSNINDIIVYPNPSGETATVSFTLQRAASVLLKITDLLGRTVKTMPLQNMNAGSQNMNVQTHTLSSGAYYLLLQVDNKTITRRLEIVN